MLDNLNPEIIKILNEENSLNKSDIDFDKAARCPVN